MVANRTLGQIAVYGGVFAVSSGFYFKWKIQERLTQCEHYKKALQILRECKPAAEILGIPIRDGRVNLADTSRNFCDAECAQFEVPVRGPKERGTLYYWASRTDLKNGWNVDRLELGLESDTSRRLQIKKKKE